MKITESEKNRILGKYYNQSSFDILVEQTAKKDKVKQIQNLLIQKGYKITADGLFGPKTLAAFNEYMSKKGATTPTQTAGGDQFKTTGQDLPAVTVTAQGTQKAPMLPKPFTGNLTGTTERQPMQKINIPGQNQPPAQTTPASAPASQTAPQNPMEKGRALIDLLNPLELKILFNKHNN